VNDPVTVGRPDLLTTAMLRWFDDLTVQGILTTDGALVIRSWNRHLEEHSGIDASDAIGRALVEVVPEIGTRGLDVHFRAALASRPDWIEAKIGIVGCSSSLLYVAGSDQAAREKILAEFLPLFREMAAQGNDNPRALWLVGGAQLGAPPPYGGDAAKAAATLQKGLEAARNEASANASAPAYQPSWGGAENLMNLAYLYSHSALQNRSLAMAYAEGALVAAPDWHYVRDVLLVQIRALAEPSR